jgi:ADP-ribosylglycohydrolase
VTLTAPPPPRARLSKTIGRIAASPTDRSNEEQTIRSALWAAWGDAAGFPAELAGDHATLQRRFDGDATLGGPWRRRIGGRMGPTVDLPAGTYSDDTQLRMAVARCIREPGRFDVEAFSKIELPVFLSYELGAGRGTKSAARALCKRAARWYANFYDKPTAYVDGGGNGAAMRIQPHVWAAPSARPDSYLPAVLRDTVSTHGHPRALLGSALHAIALGSALHQQQLPEPGRWAGMIDYLESLPDLLGADDQLRGRWLPQWHERAGVPFAEALAGARAELRCRADVATDLALDSSHDLERRYGQLLRSLGGFDPATRGAGDTSALLALWLAWCGQHQPQQTIAMAAGAVGSDTDTVATMAGALLGAVADHEPDDPIADRDLHVAEARRLHALSVGEHTESFPHPDPLHWEPPQALSDALGTIDGVAVIAGLGPVTLEGDLIRGKQGSWQWASTHYGQRVLVKRRDELTELPDHARPRPRVPAARARRAAPAVPTVEAQPHRELPDDPEHGALLAARERFDARLVGLLWRHYASSPQGGVAKAAYFAARAAELHARSDSYRPPPDGPLPD